MVLVEGLLAKLIMDTVEERFVVVFHIPGAYLHTFMPKDKRVVMVLRDEFVSYMCGANPKYKKYVQYKNGRKVLY